LTLWILPCLFSLSIAIWPNATAASDLKERFQSALDGLQKQYGFPGATAAYVLKDGSVGVAATGVADLESRAPMTVRSRMLSASIGKTFVGATALALAREGKLDLDAPISRWLGDRPWFSHLPNHAAITLRHLLNHTSGLADHVHLTSFASAVSRKWRSNSNPFTPDDLIGFTLDLSPLFDSGKGWAYSDTGYILIGLVIEKVTGRSYYTEIKQRFLKPLGLHLTAPADRRMLPGLAAGYMATSNPFGLPRKTTRTVGTLQWHPGFEWTGGGLVSNSRDLAIWGAALFQERAMSGRYLVDLLNSVPVSADSPDIRYGTGVAVYRTGAFGPVYGHGGWIPGYSSSLRFYVDHGITVAFQINTDIGIVDDAKPVIRNMEFSLAEIVISAPNAATPNRNELKETL
jgi:D-alanyl-D-alanine carboxypeptidase